MSEVDAIRVILVIATLVVGLVLSVRIVLAYRFVSRAQKYFASSLYLLLVTAAWDTLTFIGNDAPFSWRKIPYALAIVFLALYLSEPYEKARKRFGTTPLAPEPLKELIESSRIHELVVSREELRNRLYETARRSNEKSLEILELRRRLTEVTNELESLRRKRSVQ